jgi:hypothetical protein
MRALMAVGLIFGLMFLVVLNAFGHENNRSRPSQAGSREDAAQEQRPAPRSSR